MQGHYDSRVIPDLPYIATHDWKIPNELIDVRAYGLGHDGLGYPREEENCDLRSRKRCRGRLMWWIVASLGEKRGLLIIVVIRYCRRPHWGNLSRKTPRRLCR